MEPPTSSLVLHQPTPIRKGDARRSASIFSRRGVETPDIAPQHISNFVVKSLSRSSTRHINMDGRRKISIRRRGSKPVPGTVLHAVPQANLIPEMTPLEHAMVTEPNEEILSAISDKNVESTAPSPQAQLPPSSVWNRSPTAAGNGNSRRKDSTDMRIGVWKNGMATWQARRSLDQSRQQSPARTSGEGRRRASEDGPRTLEDVSRSSGETTRDSTERRRYPVKTDRDAASTAGVKSNESSGWPLPPVVESPPERSLRPTLSVFIPPSKSPKPVEQAPPQKKPTIAPAGAVSKYNILARQSAAWRPVGGSKHSASKSNAGSSSSAKTSVSKHSQPIINEPETTPLPARDDPSRSSTSSAATDTADEHPSGSSRTSISSSNDTETNTAKALRPDFETPQWSYLSSHQSRRSMSDAFAIGHPDKAGVFDDMDFNLNKPLPPSPARTASTVGTVRPASSSGEMTTPKDATSDPIIPPVRPSSQAGERPKPASLSELTSGADKSKGVGLPLGRLVKHKGSSLSIDALDRFDEEFMRTDPNLPEDGVAPASEAATTPQTAVFDKTDQALTPSALRVRKEIKKKTKPKKSVVPLNAGRRMSTATPDARPDSEVLSEGLPSPIRFSTGPFDNPKLVETGHRRKFSAVMGMQETMEGETNPNKKKEPDHTEVKDFEERAQPVSSDMTKVDEVKASQLSPEEVPEPVTAIPAEDVSVEASAKEAEEERPEVPAAEATITAPSHVAVNVEEVVTPNESLPDTASDATVEDDVVEASMVTFRPIEKSEVFKTPAVERTIAKASDVDYFGQAVGKTLPEASKSEEDLFAHADDAPQTHLGAAVGNTAEQSNIDHVLEEPMQEIDQLIEEHKMQEDDEPVTAHPRSGPRDVVPTLPTISTQDSEMSMDETLKKIELPGVKTVDSDLSTDSQSSLNRLKSTDDEAEPTTPPTDIDGDEKDVKLPSRVPTVPRKSRKREWRSQSSLKAPDDLAAVLRRRSASDSKDTLEIEQKTPPKQFRKHIRKVSSADNLPEVVNFHANEEAAQHSRSNSGAKSARLSILIPTLTFDDGLCPVDGPMSAQDIAELPGDAPARTEPRAAELVLLRIMTSLPRLVDLASTAIINKGMRRVYKQNELALLRTVLQNQSMPAWEFREWCPPQSSVGMPDGEVRQLDYTVQSFKSALAADERILKGLKEQIAERCQSFLRPSTVVSISGYDEDGKQRFDDAFYRIWCFCKIFGSNKGREDDVTGQLDWLKGGIVANQQACEATVNTNLEFEMSSILLNAPEHFAACNVNGLSADQLFDMDELWICLSSLLQSYMGKTKLARSFGVYNSANVKIGDIEKEEAVLEEWIFYLLTLGPAVILDMAKFAVDPANGFALARANKWTEWNMNSTSSSRSTFFSQPVKRLYEDRMNASAVDSEGRQKERELKDLSRKRVATLAAEIRLARTSSSYKRLPLIDMSQERPWSILSRQASTSSMTTEVSQRVKPLQPGHQLHTSTSTPLLNGQHGTVTYTPRPAFNPRGPNAASTAPVSSSATKPQTRVAHLPVSLPPPTATHPALRPMEPPMQQSQQPQRKISPVMEEQSEHPLQGQTEVEVIKKYQSIREHERDSDRRGSSERQRERNVEVAINAIVDMGFSAQQAKDALRITEGTSVDRALDWLCGRQTGRIAQV